MKRLFSLFTCTLLLLACGGGDDAGGGGTPTGGSEYLNVSNVDIPGGNTTATLNIQASQNCEWVISWNDSWIRSVSPTKGRGTRNAGPWYYGRGVLSGGVLVWRCILRFFRVNEILFVITPLLFPKRITSF